MSDQQNYILPLRNNADIPSKPPLLHWLALGISNLSGSLDELSIRLPSAILSALTVAILFYFVASIERIALALITTLILITSFEWNRSSGHARVDMCFATWLNISLFSWFQILRRSIENSRVPLILWFLLTISLALAILSKGPATIILFGVVIISYLLICNQEIRNSIFTLKNFSKISSSVLLAAVLSGIWYYLAYQQGGNEFLSRHILGENFSRIVSVDGYEPGHYKPFYYSLIYLLSGMLPWSLFLPLIIIQTIKTFKQNLHYQNHFFIFSLAIFLTFFFVVTLSSSKRDVYFLPAFPAMAYLTAVSLYKNNHIFPFLKKIITPLTFLLTLVLVTVFFALIGGKYFIDPIQLASLIHLKEKDLYLLDLLPELTKTSELIFILTASILLFYSTILLYKNNLKQSCLYIGSAFLIINVLGNYFILPMVSKIDDPRQFIDQVNLTVSKNDPLYQYKDNFFPVLYYARRPIKFLGTTEELKNIKNPYILVADNKLQEVLDLLPQCKLINKSRTFSANGGHKLALVGCGN